uniref:Uncharacterized protein n=1 Tax=Arundo donax TaxID=35708 RepID=A0A0A8Z0P4_ARUDO
MWSWLSMLSRIGLCWSLTKVVPMYFLLTFMLPQVGMLLRGTLGTSCVRRELKRHLVVALWRLKE